MSGGVAYVFDEDRAFAQRCNQAMVALEPVLAASDQQARGGADQWHLARADEELLRDLIERQFRYTGSFRAKAILENWEAHRPRFIKVMPHEYRRALQRMAEQRASVAAAAKQPAGHPIEALAA
jgi:glutamate synthase domain-containing protein 3